MILPASPPALGAVPPCPPWCVSDHPAEDTVTETLIHRPHLSLPVTIKPPGREVVTVVQRDDVLVCPDPGAPGRWGMGTPQVRVRIQESSLVLRSSEDLTTACLLLDELQDWPREAIQRLTDAALIAWPEWLDDETHDMVMRRLRREGVARV